MSRKAGNALPPLFSPVSGGNGLGTTIKRLTDLALPRLGLLVVRVQTQGQFEVHFGFV